MEQVAVVVRTEHVDHIADGCPGHACASKCRVPELVVLRRSLDAEALDRLVFRLAAQHNINAVKDHIVRTIQADDPELSVESARIMDASAARRIGEGHGVRSTGSGNLANDKGLVIIGPVYIEHNRSRHTVAHDRHDGLGKRGIVVSTSTDIE